MTAESAVSAERMGLWHGVAPMAVFQASLDPQAQLVRGEGVWVVDRGGRRFLDARSGLWNLAFGYSHAGIVEAMVAQARELPGGVTIRFEEPPAVTVGFAEALLDAFQGAFTAVKLYQSGAQAVEGAVLLTRHLARIKGEPERRVVVALRRSWHGTGVAAGSLTGEEYLHHSMGGLIDDVVHVPPPYCFRCPWGLTRPSCELRCASAMRERIDEIGADRVAAVVVEPVLGTNVVDPPEEYLPALAEVCRDRGILLIADEITTGFGRTGSLARSFEQGVHPDILLLGKGISGGYLPLTAMLIGGGVSRTLLDEGPSGGFPHGSTNDGYPMASAAGLAVLAAFEDGSLLDHVRSVSAHLRARLATLRSGHPAIVDVRGRGLMWGLEFADGTAPWSEPRMAALRFACMDEHLLVHTNGSVLDLMPPLIITIEECDVLCDRLDRALRSVEDDW